MPYVPWFFGCVLEFSTTRRHNGADVVNVATGIMFLYQTSGTDWGTVPIGFVLPYFSISLALDVLLTLMIVARLIRYIGNIRTAMGRTEIGGLCKAIVITFIESSALYAASSLLVVGRSNVGTTVVLLPILAETQVRAFSRPQSLDGLSDVRVDWTGHRSAAHHPTIRQQECVDEKHRCLRTY